jgi:hypothetical protein
MVADMLVETPHNLHGGGLHVHLQLEFTILIGEDESVVGFHVGLLGELASTLEECETDSLPLQLAPCSLNTRSSGSPSSL